MNPNPVPPSYPNNQFSYQPNKVPQPYVAEKKVDNEKPNLLNPYQLKSNAGGAPQKPNVAEQPKKFTAEEMDNFLDD